VRAILSGQERMVLRAHAHVMPDHAASAAKMDGQEMDGSAWVSGSSGQWLPYVIT